MSHLQRQKSRMEVARGWGEDRIGAYCSVGTKFQFGKMKSSEMDGGDGCT